MSAPGNRSGEHTRRDGLIHGLIAITASIAGLALIFLLSARPHPPVISWQPPGEKARVADFAATRLPEVSQAAARLESPASTVAIDRDFGAAAVEQLSPTSYAIHVRLASGTEQFIPITAPPGGLQLEVRDMSGDNVANDFVLRPALVHWPLLVLLNNGDHYSVAISSAAPDSLNSRERALGSRQAPQSSALASSLPDADRPANHGRVIVPQLQPGLFSLHSKIASCSTRRNAVSGRAPPAIGI